MIDWRVAMAMIDRLDGLVTGATTEVINLHKTYKPPCAQYVAVRQIIEGVMHEALKRQRELMLSESKN